MFFLPSQYFFLFQSLLVSHLYMLPSSMGQFHMGSFSSSVETPLSLALLDSLIASWCLGKNSSCVWFAATQMHTHSLDYLSHIIELYPHLFSKTKCTLFLTLSVSLSKRFAFWSFLSIHPLAIICCWCNALLPLGQPCSAAGREEGEDCICSSSLGEAVQCRNRSSELVEEANGLRGRASSSTFC